jgi:hypothetical protein
MGPPVVPGPSVEPAGEHEAMVIASVAIKPTVFSFRLIASPQLGVYDLDATNKDAVPARANTRPTGR